MINLHEVVVNRKPVIGAGPVNWSVYHIEAFLARRIVKVYKDNRSGRIRLSVDSVDLCQRKDQLMYSILYKAQAVGKDTKKMTDDSIRGVSGKY
jgi:hypothetical protein